MSAAGEYLQAALKEKLEDLPQRKLEPLEVCVIDSGVDASHPDLAGRVVKAYQISSLKEYVNDRLEEKPVVLPVEVGTNNDDFGHGTGVSSIICRIAPNASIVDIRVLGKDNKGSNLALVKGLSVAVERKSRLVNMSVAANKLKGKTILSLCEKAYLQNQIIVAAKRNNPFPDSGYPAVFSNVISIDNETFPSPFLFRYLPGELIEYAAHGEEVPCAAPGGGYTTSTGTSFATPTVCGLCALIIGAYPMLRPFELKTLLKAFATDKDFDIE